MPPRFSGWTSGSPEPQRTEPTLPATSVGVEGWICLKNHPTKTHFSTLKSLSNRLYSTGAAVWCKGEVAVNLEKK